MEQEFQTRFRDRLVPEQTRAVLSALSTSIPGDATLGDVVDAARTLGWSEPFGALTLGDLAEALRKDTPSRQPDAAASSTPSEAPAPSSPPTPTVKRAAAKDKPTVAKSSPARLKSLRARLDAEDKMSLDEAAEVLVPIVASLETATMQALEDFTGIGRRKLRFHIGQLVRNGYVERHGMGRGTHYTVASS